MVASLPDYINWDYVCERFRRYCSGGNSSDDLLYRIGTHVNILNSGVIGCQTELFPIQRFEVLNWLACHEFAIQGDLALLIFGRDQLTQWLERSRIAYPDFEFYLVFEYRTHFQSGCTDGICFSMHWAPKPGAPEPDVECDFPWKLYWEVGSMFWSECMGNQFDFCLSCYPNQQSFATPGSFCVEGDRYTTLSDEEKDLMSVAQVLQHFS